jgi:hypothetical protein
VTIEPIRLEAECLACELEIALTSVSEVVDWADSWIARLDHPPHNLIEVATAGSRSVVDVVHLLREISLKPRDRETLRAVFRQYGVKLRERPEMGRHIAKNLYHMVLDREWSSEDFRGEMYMFDDEYDLARSGYGSEQDVTLRLQAFLDGE